MTFMCESDSLAIFFQLIDTRVSSRTQTSKNGMISLLKCRDVGLVWELHAPTHKLLKLSTMSLFLCSFRLYLGIGPPLSLEHTRMLFALRINVLAKGYR